MKYLFVTTALCIGLLSCQSNSSNTNGDSVAADSVNIADTASAESVSAETTIGDMPELIVKNTVTEYYASLAGKYSEPITNPDEQHFTTDFIQVFNTDREKYKKQAEEMTPNAGGLGAGINTIPFDPLYGNLTESELDGSMSTMRDKIEIAEVVMDDDTNATVTITAYTNTVEEGWDTGKPSTTPSQATVTLKLKKQAGKWLIDDIINADGSLRDKIKNGKAFTIEWYS